MNLMQVKVLRRDGAMGQACGAAIGTAEIGPIMTGVHQAMEF